jgi:hypothetical protein
MTVMQLTCPNLPPLQGPGGTSAAVKRDGERPCILPADRPTTLTAQFRPLDPGIVNETIPAFFIGRNKDGFWVARDVNGLFGGIFLLESSALFFARRNSAAAGCATIYLSERFELDLENRGNPLVAPLGLWMRLAASRRQLLAAFVGRMTEAVKRWLKDS